MGNIENSREYKFEANEYPLHPGIRLIEASAGTGKTFALAHLVLRLITEQRFSLKQLLVVTFTEAAAAELKSRISKRLESALNGLENSNQNQKIELEDEVLKDWINKYANVESKRSQHICLILEALEYLDRADITTIHGFCKRTIMRETLESGEILNPTIENDGKELIKEISHSYWQQEILSLAPEHLKGLKDSNLSIDSLGEALLKIDSDPSLSFDELSSKIDLARPLATQFNDWVKISWDEFILRWEEGGNELEEYFCDLAKEWRSIGIKDTSPYSPKPHRDRSSELSNWIHKINSTSKEFLTEPVPSFGEIRSQILLGNYFHPGISYKLSKKLGSENWTMPNSKLQNSIANLWDGPIENVWRHALNWTLHALNERRRKQGLISYGGLLKALDPSAEGSKFNQKNTSNELLLKTIKHRYKVALIDEFQDTDTLQWRILKSSFGNSPNHLLVMVGDPKQAIYRFRGGDLDTYLMARDEVDRVDILVENFRTTPLLMNSLNQLMAIGLTRSKLKVPMLLARSEEDIPDSQNHQSMQILTFKDHESEETIESKSLPSKTSLETLIPTAVTNAVVEMLHSYSGRIEPSDICILVSKHDQAASIRKQLAMAGIASRLVSKGDVLTSDASLYLQRFLDCLANPADSSSLRLVACSPLMQWTVEDIKAAETNGELNELASKFHNWSRTLPKIGLLGCLAELLNGQKIADLSERGRLLGDLQQCAQLVQEVIHLQGLNSKSAARWLKRQRLQPLDTVPDNRLPHSDVAESSINILTVHRSKGLEFRVVICPYLWQSPLQPYGPLWRSKQNSSWELALNCNWGKGAQTLEIAKEAALKEIERLCYVALTRARNKLMIVWVRGAKQEGSPLIPLLFGPKAIDKGINNLNLNSMKDWLNTNKIPATIITAKTNELDKYKKADKTTEKLSLGPIPTRNLEVKWRRSSYSSWVADTVINVNSCLSNPIEIEEGKDCDKGKEEFLKDIIQLKKDANIKKQTEESHLDKIGPLSDFPRGPLAGDCLHKILEKLDFKEAPNTQSSINIIESELRRAGIDQKYLSSIQEAIERVLTIPLGGPLKNLKLNQLEKKNCMRELSFDLPLAHSGKDIKAVDIAEAFAEDENSRFTSAYCEKLKSLNISGKGFLTGSIDFVFPDNKDLSKAKWWVLDWKSNWVGERKLDGETFECGPFHYHDAEMETQMNLHHYPLQAHLYLLALHRFLKWRLPNYSPKLNLGGYIYVFLRGIPKPNIDLAQQNDQHTPGLIVEEAPIKRIISLSRKFEFGGICSN